MYLKIIITKYALAITFQQANHFIPTMDKVMIKCCFVPKKTPLYILTLGIFVVIVLNMLTRTRKTVINRVILDRKRKYIISYFLKPYTFTYLSFSLYQSIFKSHFICKFLIGETHNSITHSLTMTRKTVINRVILDRS